MDRPSLTLLSLLLALAGSASAEDRDALIRVRADRPGPEASPHMTGACIEDVNHEIYGGIDSQMVFGEGFQEPPPATVDGFVAYGGTWAVKEGAIHAAAGEGPKLIADRPAPATGEVSVRIRFADDGPGLAGLIVKVGDPAVGADRFRGYEISLDPSRQLLILGRHRGNWEPIREVPCEVPAGRWIDLAVRMTDATLEIRVDGRAILQYEDAEHPLPEGAIGLRTWKREASFRELSLRDGSTSEAIPFRPAGTGGVSGMWRPVKRGSASGGLSLETERPHVGTQAQRIAFRSGDGAIGVENRGLNRWGMNFVAGKPYEGSLWVRADGPVQVFIAAENGDGSRVHAEAVLAVEGNEWKRHEFTLTPTEDDESGRLSITLRAPGSVVLGHAFLQPGTWGRFKGLPVRKDVAEGLIDAGITVMRLGGLMANGDDYRWKKMIGPRDRRPPYRGFWYPHSSNGWGIFEFLGFCEAAGFLPIVDLNMDETPADLADFLEYANGPADSAWGRRRAEDGHPEPYRLKYIELGNEEAVDEAYWRKFKPLAEAAWAKDPGIILIVGDFEYRRPIVDPHRFEGAPRITSLAAHKEILDLAKANGRQVWFDVHIWNHNPKDARERIAALGTFDAALARLSPGADYRLCVLEENATNHAVRRAVAHGETVNGLMRMGNRVRVVCAANALQPDGQNDNGWDQGLVFLNPSRAWLQPPAYVSRMISHREPRRVVDVAVEGADGVLDVTAARSSDGAALILQVANLGETPQASRIDLEGFVPTGPEAAVEELTGPLDAANTADNPTRLEPKQSRWRHAAKDGGARYTFPPHSFTTLRFE